MIDVGKPGLAKYGPLGISHVVNPGISQDRKYPQNLEKWEILGNKNSYKKDLLYFFLFFTLKIIFLNFTGFIMLLHPLRLAIK